MPVPTNQQAPAFGSLERQIASNLTASQPGLRDDWTEVLGCWVLGPPAAVGEGHIDTMCLSVICIFLASSAMIKKQPTQMCKWKVFGS